VGSSGAAAAAAAGAPIGARTSSCFLEKVIPAEEILKRRPLPLLTTGYWLTNDGWGFAGEGWVAEVLK
jgi:hypothetical protein